MLRGFLQSRAAVAAVTVVLVVTTTGATLAVASGSSKQTAGPTLYGCAKVRGGDLRVVRDPIRCKTVGPRSTRERLVKWNKRGVQGYPGPRGRRGSTGMAGAAGAAGPGVMVLDGNGDAVGPLIDIAYYGQARLLTNSGYFLTMDRNGTLSSDSVYYTTSDCSGTPYSGANWAHYVVHDRYGSRLLVGVGPTESVTLLTQSYDIGNCQPAMFPPSTAQPLEEVTPATVGIASADGVVGPISFSPR